MKKFAVLLVGILMIFNYSAMVQTGLAEESASDFQIVPFYTYISIIEASLSISGSTATCYGEVSTSSSYDISITMTLMRRSGSIWVTVRSWTGSGSGLGGASLNRTYSLTTSGDYKVVVLGKILDGSGNVLESASRSSGVETY